jgi:hypothetical protein
MRRGGARNEETFWKEDGSLEAVWKELEAQAGAQGRSSTQSTRPAPLLDLKVGARLRVCDGGQVGHSLMGAGCEMGGGGVDRTLRIAQRRGAERARARARAHGDDGPFFSLRELHAHRGDGAKNAEGV